MLMNFLNTYSLKTILKPEMYLVVIFSAFCILMNFGLFSSFRWLIVLHLLLMFLLYARLKNILLSSVIVLLFSLMFFQPNKYYAVEVIPAYELLSLLFQEGYFIAYGLNITNIFTGISILLLIRELFTAHNKGLLMLKHTKLLLISALVFFVCGFFASASFSPFPQLSFTWLLQYLQLFVIAILIFAVIKDNANNRKIIYMVIVMMVLFESVLGFRQYITQSLVGLPIESQGSGGFAYNSEENNAIIRIPGTFLYHNQFAFVMLLLTAIVFPVALKTNTRIYLLALFCAVVIIIMIQSRAIWFALLISALVYIRLYPKIVTSFLSSLPLRKLVFYALILFPIVSVSLIPRLLLSFNIGNSGGAISVRREFFQEATEAFIQNPLGYGVGTNEFVLHSLFPAGVTSVFPSAVHMGFLQLLLEVGAIGLFFLSLPFLWILRKVIVLSIMSKKMLSIPAMTFVTGLIIIIVYYLFHPHVGLIEFPFIGIILGFGLTSIYEFEKSS